MNGKKSDNMRIISFSQRWNKLSNPEFTTYRFPRKDADWQEGEIVQVYLNNRSPKRECMGVVEIINITANNFKITEEEAKEDGFENYNEWFDFMCKTYTERRMYDEPMNKLTLRWQNYEKISIC